MSDIVKSKLIDRRGELPKGNMFACYARNGKTPIKPDAEQRASFYTAEEFQKQRSDRRLTNKSQ